MEIVLSKDADTFVRRVSEDKLHLDSDEKSVYLVQAATGERVELFSLNGEPSKSSADRFALVNTLSDRELQVFRALGEGIEMSAIAARLEVSVKTIETYRARLKTKLEIKSRAKLITFAVEWTVKGLPLARQPIPSRRFRAADGDGKQVEKSDSTFSSDGSQSRRPGRASLSG